MPQYILAIHHPDNYDPSSESEAMLQDISRLNQEMIAAGVRKLACGLGKAISLRAQPSGEVVVTDGPYLETREHVGGFWILETADLEEALSWARKATQACRAPAEVREMFFRRPASTKD
ncbi:MAG TPA: YciI family protein [Bryobacteraceae bacterium]|jgi:hypothetical protein|nr:YciI family protein [Bryobacteraceae bacterium]